MIWRRDKYHLNALLLLLPVLFIGHYAAMWESGPPDGARRLPAQPVGGWRAHVYVDRLEPGGLMDVHARFSDGAYQEIRAAFMAIDDEPPPRHRLLEIGYSAALHGGEPHLEAHVPVPERLRGDEFLWLTVEGWDGSIQRTSWPLQER